MHVIGNQETRSHLEWANPWSWSPFFWWTYAFAVCLPSGAQSITSQIWPIGALHISWILLYWRLQQNIPENQYPAAGGVQSFWLNTTDLRFTPKVFRVSGWIQPTLHPKQLERKCPSWGQTDLQPSAASPELQPVPDSTGGKEIL